MTKKFLYNFIRQYKYGILSTVSPDNSPESACVGFVATPDLRIVFDTVSDSRKYKNLMSNPKIAFVFGCDNEQTIQYEGVAKVPGVEEADKLLQIYFKVFPDGIIRKENWKNIAYFCVEPKWIRYSNFNEANTQIEEIKL